MKDFRLMDAARMAAAACCLGWLGAAAAPAQQLDSASVIRHIDAAVRARYENVLGFTVTEHYAVYRGKAETHPAAEITVKTTYRKGVGKSYVILAQSGSDVIQKFGLKPLLDNEKNINNPDNVEKSWLTSANYEMKLNPGGIRRVNGRDCLVLAITPKRKAPNLIDGTMWVDAKDASIVQILGVASKSPSVWAGPTQMMRQYANINGFSQATHARAVSHSFLFGQTTVTIDYRDYQIQLRQPR
jgi:hypothetical protein